MRLGALSEEQSLSRANYLQVLLENTLDIVAVLQPTGALLYTSPAVSRVLDYDLGECPGKNIFDFVHPDDLAAAKKALDETIRNPGNVGRVEFRCRHHDGSWRDLEALSKNLLDNPGVAAIVVNARDITLRKEAERALLQSQASFSADAVVALCHWPIVA